jgi:hypothetical protein
VFLDLIREPHLLVPALNRADNNQDEGASFLTVRFKPRAPGGAKDDIQGVLPVRKRRDSNAFAMMITLGRAPNNDLVIPDQRVSKFHAYFRRIGEQWAINDANSMNGTWVDGQQIPSGQSAPLRSGARIALAETLELIFLDANDLFARVTADKAHA